MVNYMAITCLNMNTNDRNTKGTVPSVSHNPTFKGAEFDPLLAEAYSQSV